MILRNDSLAKIRTSFKCPFASSNWPGYSKNAVFILESLGCIATINEFIANKSGTTTAMLLLHLQMILK